MSGGGPGQGLDLTPRPGLEGGEGAGGGGGREEPGGQPVRRSVAWSIVSSPRRGWPTESSAGGNKTIGNRCWAYTHTIFHLNSNKNQPNNMGGN